MDKIKFILIPHAGKKYAGDCRYKVFNKIKNIENIIYITALHNSLYLKKNLKNKNFIIKDECKLFNKNNAINFIKNNNIIKNEHSYEWVKDELRTKFKNAKHTVITPGPSIKLEDYKVNQPSLINENIYITNNPDNPQLSKTDNGLNFEDIDDTSVNYIIGKEVFDNEKNLHIIDIFKNPTDKTYNTYVLKKGSNDLYRKKSIQLKRQGRNYVKV